MPRFTQAFDILVADFMQCFLSSASRTKIRVNHFNQQAYILSGQRLCGLKKKKKKREKKKEGDGGSNMNYNCFQSQ